MKLYLLRHGETDFNAKGLLQGWIDEPLNSAGIAVARATRDGLKRAGIQFDRVYSSTLKRAIETATIICGECVSLTLDPRLRELSFGAYEGLCYPNLSCPIPCPGGESLEDLENRVQAFFEDLLQTKIPQDETILLSTHGMTIRAILKIFGYYPTVLDVPAHDNCGISILQTDGFKHRVSLVQANILFY